MLQLRRIYAFPHLQRHAGKKTKVKNFQWKKKTKLVGPCQPCGKKQSGWGWHEASVGSLLDRIIAQHVSSIDLSDIPNTVLEQFFSSNNASCLGTWLGTSWTVKVVLTPTSTHSNKDVDVSNVRPTFCVVASLYLNMISPLVDCFCAMTFFHSKLTSP